MKSNMAMLVMPAERRRSLQPSLEQLNLKVVSAANCHEARTLLKGNPPLDVVITDVSLVDGNWCDVFRYLIDHEVHASLVVSSHQADERLFSEVLWRGAYDLIVEPFAADEVRKVIEGALRASFTRVAALSATA